MEGEESATAVPDPGFVLDAASGLYYHASSGFYYDAKAGWYYSTRDGLYYTFENDGYVPLASSSSSMSITVAEDDNKKSNTAVPEEQVVGDIVIHGAAENKSNEDGGHKDIAAAAKTEEETTAHLFTNDLHSDSTAWVQPGGETADWQSLGEDNKDKIEVQVAAVSSATEEEETRPASVWIQEALVELYLQNYPNSEVGTSGSAEAFVDSSSLSYDVYNVQNAGIEEGGTNNTYMHGIDNYAIQSNFPDADFVTRSHYEEATGMDAEAYMEHGTNANEFHESDDGSEELEEGEWRPEEGERDKYIFDDSDEEEEAEEGEICDSEEPSSQWDQQQGSFLSREDDGTQEQSGGLSISNQEYREYEYGNNNRTVSGNGQVHSYAADLTEAPSEAATDGQRESALEVGISVEEQWHAHYSRVPRPGVRVRLYPGSIELWDWTTVEQEQKTAKKKKARKLSVRLVGRLAPNSNNLHPSLGGSGGFIRTSPISEVDHEFVKVSSGRIYKLRRPSSKHLATITTYDSLNPTCDWGFPQINTTFADGETDVTEAEDRNASASDTTKPSGDTVVSKPFVPNFGHWKFQPLVPTKRNRGPSVNPSFLTLTKDEIEEMEQRKQRYRDRAAERRTLHRGFGTGPGQKGMPVHEMEKLEAETATEMPTALAKAAKARPLGSDNIGKRMLQGMGWKEGQSLGPGEGGLINPIQALGNTGRSGLGWS